MNNQTLSEYKKEKVEILHELGYKNVTLSDFAKAKSEIAIDNIARSILFG